MFKHSSYSTMVYCVYQINGIDGIYYSVDLIAYNILYICLYKIKHSCYRVCKKHKIAETRNTILHKNRYTFANLCLFGFNKKIFCSRVSVTASTTIINNNGLHHTANTKDEMIRIVVVVVVFLFFTIALFLFSMNLRSLYWRYEHERVSLSLYIFTISNDWKIFFEPFSDYSDP